MVSIIDDVVDGGPLQFHIPEESCGPFLHGIMKNLRAGDEAHTNADTGEVMTNGQFLKMCESIAVGLESIGVQQGDMIVVMGENTFRISATVIACLFIAAPVGALDENLKSVELKNLLQYFQPKIVFCNRKQVKDTLVSLDALNLKSTRVILLDADELEPTDDSRIVAFPVILASMNGPFYPKSVSNNEEEIALVIPSSGSTGLPKGVALSHRSVVCTLAKGKSSKAPVEGTLTTLQFSHLYWISGMMSLLISCMGTHRIFLSDESDANLLRAIKKYKPNWTFLAPPMVSTMLKHPDFKSEDAASLKFIVTGGAPLTEFVRDEMKKKMPNIFQIHAYGITEIGGGVTKFYPSNDITCVGQVDAGIKLKVSPEEIESCLATMPGVFDCGVVGIPNEQDQFHAMALVVKDKLSTITQQDVCEYIKENMSEANQLHGGVRFVNSIPRTPAKKVRRNELQELALSILS